MPEQKRLPLSAFAAMHYQSSWNPPKSDRATPLPSETWTRHGVPEHEFRHQFRRFCVWRAERNIERHIRQTQVSGCFLLYTMRATVPETAVKRQGNIKICATPRIQGRIFCPVMTSVMDSWGIWTPHGLPAHELRQQFRPC